jgi:hypothetical protein
MVMKHLKVERSEKWDILHVLVCVLFLLMYIVAAFLFVYKFTDHCHWVETQLQLIMYHIPEEWNPQL